MWMVWFPFFRFQNIFTIGPNKLCLWQNNTLCYTTVHRVRACRMVCTISQTWFTQPKFPKRKRMWVVCSESHQYEQHVAVCATHSPVSHDRSVKHWLSRPRIYIRVHSVHEIDVQQCGVSCVHIICSPIPVQYYEDAFVLLCQRRGNALFNHTNR